MPTVKTTYLGGLRTEAVHLQSGTKIYTDAPTDNHGKGESFSPTDLFAASFASCALTFIGIAADAHGFDAKGTVVETTKIMAAGPRRIAELDVKFILPDKHYSDKEKKFIEAAIGSCAVGNTLADSAVKINKTIVYRES